MAALPTHVDPGLLPVNVTQPEMGDVARAKAQTGEQQQNGTIPPTHRGRRIARRNHAFHIIGRKRSWEYGQPPVRHARNGGVQSDSAVALRYQKPHEHPNRRCTGLDGRRATTTTLARDKGPQAVRIPLAWHVSKLCQQLANVTAVARQGGNTSPRCRRIHSQYLDRSVPSAATE